MLATLASAPRRARIGASRSSTTASGCWLRGRRTRSPSSAGGRGDHAALSENRGRPARVPRETVLLDGEIVAEAKAAAPAFQRLQARMHLTSRATSTRRWRSARARLFFDCLGLEGHDLRGLTLAQRKGASRPSRAAARNRPTVRSRARARRGILRGGVRDGLEGSSQAPRSRYSGRRTPTGSRSSATAARIRDRAATRAAGSRAAVGAAPRRAVRGNAAPLRDQGRLRVRHGGSREHRGDSGAAHRARPRVRRRKPHRRGHHWVSHASSARFASPSGPRGRAPASDLPGTPSRPRPEDCRREDL